MQEKSTIIFNKFYSFIKHFEEKEDKRAKNAERLKRDGAAGCKTNEADKEANNSFVYKSRLFCFVQRQVCRIFTLLLYK